MSDGHMKIGEKNRLKLAIDELSSLPSEQSLPVETKPALPAPLNASSSGSLWLPDANGNSATQATLPPPPVLQASNASPTPMPTSHPSLLPPPSLPPKTQNATLPHADSLPALPPREDSAKSVQVVRRLPQVPPRESNPNPNSHVPLQSSSAHASPSQSPPPLPSHDHPASLPQLKHKHLMSSSSSATSSPTFPARAQSTPPPLPPHSPTDFPPEYAPVIPDELVAPNSSAVQLQQPQQEDDWSSEEEDSNLLQSRQKETEVSRLLRLALLQFQNSKGSGSPSSTSPPLPPPLSTTNSASESQQSSPSQRIHLTNSASHVNGTRTPSPNLTPTAPTVLSGYPVTAIGSSQSLTNSASLPPPLPQKAKPPVPNKKPINPELMKQQRFNVINEIYETEKNYHDDLSVLQDLKKPIQSFLADPNAGLEMDVDRVIEPSLTKIISCSTVIFDRRVKLSHVQLTHLEERLANKTASEGNAILVGHIFQHIADFLLNYLDYIINYETLIGNFKKLQLSGKKFPMMLRAFMQPHSNKSAEDLFILPIQRIPRYTMLLEQTLQKTLSDNEDYAPLTGAIEKIKEMTIFLNEEKRKSDGRNLAMKVHTEFGRSFTKPNTIFEYEDILYATPITSRADMKSAKEKYRIIFFNTKIWLVKLFTPADALTANVSSQQQPQEFQWIEKLSYRPNDKDGDPFALENQSIIFCLRPANAAHHLPPPSNAASNAPQPHVNAFQPHDLSLQFPLLYKVLGSGVKLYSKSVPAYEALQANYTSLKIAFKKEEAGGKQFVTSKSKQLKDGMIESGSSLFRKSKNLSTTLARKSDVKKEAKEKEGS